MQRPNYGVEHNLSCLTVLFLPYSRVQDKLMGSTAHPHLPCASIVAEAMRACIGQGCLSTCQLIGAEGFHNLSNSAELLRWSRLSELAILTVKATPEFVAFAVSCRIERVARLGQVRSGTEVQATESRECFMAKRLLFAETGLSARCSTTFCKRRNLV